MNVFTSYVYVPEEVSEEDMLSLVVSHVDGVVYELISEGTVLHTVRLSFCYKA